MSNPYNKKYVKPSNYKDIANKIPKDEININKYKDTVITPSVTVVYLNIVFVKLLNKQEQATVVSKIIAALPESSSCTIEESYWEMESCFYLRAAVTKCTSKISMASLLAGLTSVQLDKEIVDLNLRRKLRRIH